MPVHVAGDGADGADDIKTAEFRVPRAGSETPKFAPKIFQTLILNSDL